LHPHRNISLGIRNVAPQASVSTRADSTRFAPLNSKGTSLGRLQTPALDWSRASTSRGTSLGRPRHTTLSDSPFPVGDRPRLHLRGGASATNQANCDNFIIIIHYISFWTSAGRSPSSCGRCPMTTPHMRLRPPLTLPLCHEAGGDESEGNLPTHRCHSRQLV